MNLISLFHRRIGVHMKSTIKYGIGCLLFLLNMTGLRSQTSIQFTSYLIRDDNAFKSREAYDELINSSSLLIGHRFGGESLKIQAYYNGDLLSYSTHSGLSNSAHKIGLSGQYVQENVTVNLRGTVKRHIYQEQVSYYDVDRYNLNLNMQYNPGLSSYYSLGLGINRDQYQAFEDLDNLSYQLSGKMQRFFQSKLSLTLESWIGIKNYVNQSVIQYYGQGNAGNPFVRYREDPVEAAQIGLSINVAKSLTSRLGANLQVGGRRFLGDPIEAYSNGIYYYTENDLYDDPYSFQDGFVKLQVTNQFAIGFQGKIGVRYQSKDYAGTPALDEAGELLGETRQDQRIETFLFLSKKFTLPWSFPSSVDVFINLMVRNNPSNDPYYDFEDRIGLMGFSVTL